MKKTPDIRPLVLRDMVAYFESCGLSTIEANKRAEKLMEFVDREAAKFAPSDHRCSDPQCGDSTWDHDCTV